VLQPGNDALYHLILGPQWAEECSIPAFAPPYSTERRMALARMALSFSS
jgi:hypothetical protein